MTKNQMAVRVERAKDTPPPLGGDLFEWIDIVWDAVWRNFDEFGGGDMWDVWPVEVHMNHVVVENIVRSHYYRADIVVDAEKEKISFTNIQRVTHQWALVDGEVLERGEDVPHPDLQTVMVSPPQQSQGKWAGTAVASQ